MARVAVISGSASDKQIVDDLIKILAEFKVRYDSQVISAHRNKRKLEEYVMKSDADVFIGVAGLAAHLPGFIASLTVKPVIGVPVSAKLGGLDALLSIVQMPSPIAVATVGVDGGKNAAFLALEILGVKYPNVRRKLERYRERLS